MLICRDCGCKYHADPDAYAYRQWCHQCAPKRKAIDLAGALLGALAIAGGARALAVAVVLWPY